MPEEAKTAMTLFQDKLAIQKMEHQVKEILGPHRMSAERFFLLAQRMIMKNPALLKCTALSVAASVIEAAIKGLEISDIDGQAYLVPYKGQCQLIVGYRGYNILAYRTGISLQAHCVYEKDKFQIRYGSHPEVIHEPYISGLDSKGKPGGRGTLVGAYAIATFPDGRTFPCFHDREEIERRRRLSAACDGKAWTQFYESMAAKGPIRQLGSSVIPHDIAPKLVEAAIADERREFGFEAPPPERALTAASEITGETIHDAQVVPPGEESQEPPPFSSAMGILRSVSARGKTIFISLDIGDQNSIDFSTFDKKFLEPLTAKVNSKIIINYKDNEKDGKVYHNIISFSVPEE